MTCRYGHQHTGSLTARTCRGMAPVLPTRPRWLDRAAAKDLTGYIRGVR